MIIINNRDKLDWNQGMTVQDVLDKMKYSFSYITVTVNEKLVPEEDYNLFIINDNDKVGMFHLAHGG